MSAEPAADTPCPPCRGTGRLISNQGGDPHAVTCPWCEGDGHFKRDHDAQAARAADGVSPPA